MVTKKELLKIELSKLPYYGKIQTKGRYIGIKAKAWSILSDYVRLRDFIKYGTCISSGERINAWGDTDAGHYVTMGGHGVSVGFSDINIHAQSKRDNAWGGMEAGARYKDNLVKRYGEEILKEIEILKHKSVSADDWFFIEKIKEIYDKFSQLKEEYPDYDYPEYMRNLYIPVEA